MQEKEQFKETLYNLSIEVLQEKARLLSSQLIKAKSNGESVEEIEEKLNVVKNRITALRIRS